MTQENKIKKIRNVYIIGTTRTIDGIFALANSVMSHIHYAISNGFIPVVDLKHYKNQYFKKDREYKDNVWEYFFEQPCGISLDDIKEEDNIHISENVFHPDAEYYFTPDCLPISQNNDLYQISDKKQDVMKYLKFKPDIIQYFDEQYKKIIGNKSEVLGVLCRGTDYNKKGLLHEQKQISTKLLIKKIKTFLNKNKNIKYIYLTTEDKNLYNEFKSVFKDIIIDNPQYMYDSFTDNNKFLADI